MSSLYRNVLVLLDEKMYGLFLVFPTSDPVDCEGGNRTNNTLGYPAID